jgi:hypothetical protein
MRKPRDPAWFPAPYEARDVEALQALQRGDADAAQQALALNWIIETAAGTYEPSFRSDSDGGERETAFAEGRRFVGLQVVKMIKMSPRMIATLRSKNG